VVCAQGSQKNVGFMRPRGHDHSLRKTAARRFGPGQFESRCGARARSWAIHQILLPSNRVRRSTIIRRDGAGSRAGSRGELPREQEGNGVEVCSKY